MRIFSIRKTLVKSAKKQSKVILNNRKQLKTLKKYRNQSEIGPKHRQITVLMKFLFNSLKVKPFGGVLMMDHASMILVTILIYLFSVKNSHHEIFSLAPKMDLKWTQNEHKMELQ